jgi:hypothetical protein
MRAEEKMEIKVVKRKTRRTVTLDNDVNVAIQNYRGACIRKTLKDKTYSDAVNELLREILKQKGFISDEAKA